MLKHSRIRLPEIGRCDGPRLVLDFQCRSGDPAGSGVRVAREDFDLWAPLSLRKNCGRGHGTIEIFPNPNPGRDYTIQHIQEEFTSTCPMTGASELRGTSRFSYVPDRALRGVEGG